MQKGKLDEAFDSRFAALKLLRVKVSRSAGDDWNIGSELQLRAMENLVTWSNHPSQSLMSIRRGIDRIEAELDKFPSPMEWIATRYLEDRQTYFLSSKKDVAETSDRLGARDTDSLRLWPLMLPWERLRAERLFTGQAKLNFAAIAALEKQLASPGFSPDANITAQFAAWDEMYKRITRTTPLAAIAISPLYFHRQAVLMRHTTIRAALTRMELIAYRLEHGKLPDRLVNLIPKVSGKQLVDPFSGRLFDYYPEFLLSSGRYEIELLPTGPTEVEFQSRGFHRADPNRSIAQIISGPPDEISSRLQKEGTLTQSLFRIPLPFKPEQLESRPEPSPVNSDPIP